MIACRIVAVLMSTAFFSATVAGADLTKIDRSIKKEPAYQSKSPKYCLLVFGTEAKTRIWLVLDGDTLYIDRNGNGDLTDEGDRVNGEVAQNQFKKRAKFSAGDVLDADGKTKHINVEVLQLARTDLTVQDTFVDAKVAGKHSFGAVLDPRGQLRFADRPQEAPIIHFGGALQMSLGNNSEDARTFQWEKLARGEDVYVQVGTPGLGKGTFAALSHEAVPPDVHPVAEFEFPNKKPGGPAVKLKVVLKERCWVNLFHHPVRVPAEAANGKAKVTLSFPDWKQGEVASATLEVLVVDAKGNEKK